METHKKTYYSANTNEQYARRALEADLLKLTAAVVAELLIFFLWFDGPARERYEILVHVALPLFIVLPILHYRYLIVVPFIAFLPDVARAFGIWASHSPVVLPLIFLAAFVPFVRRPKTAFIAGYTAFAIWASHLIVDARKYTSVHVVGGYPWTVLLLYALLVTVVGLMLLWLLNLREINEDNYERR